MNFPDDALGFHLLADFSACDAAVLDDLDTIERALHEAAVAAGATIVGSRFHRFAPQGVSGVLLIAESHFSVHTWPEHRFAAVDLFTCSPKLDAKAALAALERALGAGTVAISQHARGAGAVQR